MHTHPAPTTSDPSARSASAGRRRHRPLVALGLAAVLVALAATPAGAQTAPWGTGGAEVGSNSGPAPAVVLVGDSLIAHDLGIGSQNESNALRWWLGRGTYVSANNGASWVTYGWPGQQNGNSLVWDLAHFFGARLTIGALATNDARIMTSDPATYTQQAQYNIMANAVGQTRQYSACVMLVNVARRNGIWGVSYASAQTVDNNMVWLAAVQSGGGVYVADWDAYSAPHQAAWFLPGDVHMTAAGIAAYRDFITAQASNLISTKGC